MEGRLGRSARWGTTLRQGTSRGGFYRDDHDYILTAAGLAQRAGTPAFCLVSSLGADASSSLFYLKTKGETEQTLSGLGFASLVLVRPSLLIGDPRSSPRHMEAFSLFLGRHLTSLLHRRYRAVTKLQVAQALLEAGLRAAAGLHVIESEQLQG